MLSRRELLKMGVLGSGYALLPPGRAFAPLLKDDPQSPRTTPFVADLPIPPEAREVSAFASPDCASAIGSQTRFFELVSEERHLQVHPELPPTALWGYRDVNVAQGDWPCALGPTFKVRVAEGPGSGLVVRHVNKLPVGHTGFGEPELTVHQHGGHHEARSDGYPIYRFSPGERFDYCYPMRDPGFSTGQADPTDRPGINWYHDHSLDVTGPNVYRGLAGFYLVFDDLDSGNETTGLRLPSGPFDIPLMLSDKRFKRDGSLIFDPFNHDGFLGDKFLVNGAIQPRLRVKRRKYRFRLLDASSARFYRLVLSKGDGRKFPFDQIGTDAGLMSAPIRGVRAVQLGPAERMDLVIDFSQFGEGDEVFLENRLAQEDGRGPSGVLARGTPILKFIVEEAVDDPSRVPDVLRPFAAITSAELAESEVKTFVFERRHGAWVINGELVDLDRALTSSPLNEPEIWRFVNKSGGWWHPIHVHLEFMHIISRNGRPPALNERDGRAKKDTVVLGPNDVVEAFFKFRDYPGSYAFHCHNIEHEDHFMMARMDVV